MNVLLTVESQLVQFHKYAPEWIYNKYLKLVQRAETSELCAVMDEYNFSQTLRTVVY